MKKLYQDNLPLQSYQALDMAVFVKNLKGEYLWANDFFIQQSAGLESISEIYRKQDYYFPWRDYADDLRANDRLLIEQRECITAKERVLRYNGHFVNLVSKKIPVFDRKNKLAGILGLCIEVPVSTAAKLLSNREYSIVSLLALGKTDKGIGKKLNISPRTVETHINNAKTKLNVTSRTELVVKFIV